MQLLAVLCAFAVSTVPGPFLASSAHAAATDSAGHLPLPSVGPLNVTATLSESWPNGCGNFPASVQFESTISGGTPPYSYSWSFGDGGPTSSEPDPSHSYARSGPWNVTLHVTDFAGAQAYWNLTFPVALIPPCSSESSFELDLPYIALGIVLGLFAVLGAAVAIRHMRAKRAK